MKSIIIMALVALMFSGAASAQSNTTKTKTKTTNSHITGQDSASWHQPRRSTRDTPPTGRTNRNRPNLTPVQPHGINPDSNRVPGTTPSNSPVNGGR